MLSIALIHPWDHTKSPWVTIHLDFVRPFLGKMFLFLVDSYSKWFDVIPVSNTNTASLVEYLRQSFATHGFLPFVILTDNGPSFKTNEFKTFVQKNGIKHIFTAPYHPFKIFKSAIKKIIEA